MKRSLLFLCCLTYAMSMTGCESCRRLFGLDRRCEQPPQSYYQQPPMYTQGPVNYAPAPGNCNAPPMK